jgi:uncharacterized protein YjbI with pentapeptide repeats
MFGQWPEGQARLLTRRCKIVSSDSALPTRAGPVPDRLTIWPMDDGRYGLDATFQGASGYERAHCTATGWATCPTPSDRSSMEVGRCGSARCPAVSSRRLSPRSSTRALVRPRTKPIKSSREIVCRYGQWFVAGPVAGLAVAAWHSPPRTRRILTIVPDPVQPPDPPDLPPQPDTPDLSDARIVEARLTGSSLAGERRLGLSLTDCELDDCDLANLDARGAAFRRVAITGGRLTGCNLSESALVDVGFKRCRVDLVAFAASEFERVRFASCNLAQADFQQARLRAVRFEDCDLSGADLSGAKFEQVDIVGCRLDGVRGADALKGVRMRWGDVLENAGLFSAACGVELIE